jgi:hypothetical protein
MSKAIVTLVKMMESLPENIQIQVVDYLQEHIEDLKDEFQWETSFKQSQKELVNAAKKARQEISEGLAKPLDIDRL